MAQRIVAVVGNKKHRRMLAEVDDRPLCIDVCLRYNLAGCIQEAVGNPLHYHLLGTI